MGAKADPLKSYTIPGRKAPLKTGGGAKRADESPVDFFARLVKKVPRKPEPLSVMITVFEGHENLAALYYDVPVSVIKDIFGAKDKKSGKYLYPKCNDAFMRARAVRVSRDRDSDAVADLLKKEALDEIARQPDLPTRERWPVDEKDRLEAIKRWLVDDEAIVLYEGDLAKIADAGRIPLHILVRVVKSDDSLSSLKEYADVVHAARLESRLREQAARSNQPTAALKLIEAFGDDRFTPRTKVDLRKVGFSLDDDDDRSGSTGASILSIVKGGGS